MSLLLHRYALQSKGLWRAQQWGPGLPRDEEHAPDILDDDAPDSPFSPDPMAAAADDLLPAVAADGEASAADGGAADGAGGYAGVDGVGGENETKLVESPLADAGSHDGSVSEESESEEDVPAKPSAVVVAWRGFLRYYQCMMRPWSQKTGYDMYLYVTLPPHLCRAGCDNVCLGGVVGFLLSPRYTSLVQVTMLLFIVVFYSGLTGGSAGLTEELANNQFSGAMV